MEEKNATTELIENLTKPVNDSKDRISVGDLFEIVSGGGFALVFLILSLPTIIPLPIPLATIASFPLSILGIQMFCGLKTLWLPKRIRNYSIKRTTISLIVEKCAPFLRKIEKVTRKRIFFFDSEISQRLIGLLVFLSSILMALPLPFSHIFPAIGISMMSMGLLNKDGLFVMLGVLFCILGFYFIFTLAFASKAVIMYIFKLKQLVF